MFPVETHLLDGVGFVHRSSKYGPNSHPVVRIEGWTRKNGDCEAFLRVLKSLQNAADEVRAIVPPLVAIESPIKLSNKLQYDCVVSVEHQHRIIQSRPLPVHQIHALRSNGVPQIREAFKDNHVCVEIYSSVLVESHEAHDVRQILH